MNKNPFVPQPSYPQPPLPPGPPPPPQPGQSDYAAYWSGGSQPPPQQAAGPYNPAWGSQPAQTPQRPTPEQSALYANYGYSAQWQRQQQQQQLQQMQAQYHQAPPPPPVAQPPPPAAQPAYNPYQPAAGYPQAYVPQPMQAAPQPIPPPVYHPPQPQQQSFYHPPPQQQQMQQQQRHQIHHTPPQHLPPAKRQRFEGPNPTRMQHPPPQPQFQAPPPPQQNMGPFSGGQAQRGGAPGMSHMGAGRGGSQTGRGGASGGNRGGRGVATSGSRGNLSGGRGRGGSFSTGGGGMSGGRGGGSSGSLRAHGSRANFGDQNRRGGGGRSQYGYQSGSFRGGRGGGHAGSGRSGRHDGSGASAKDGHTSTGFVGKKEENRRTLTDFKIIGLEIKDLAWTWGVTPALASAPAAVKIESADEDGEKSMDHGSPQGLTEDAVKEEVKENDSPLQESRELSPIQESEPDVQQTQIDDSQVSIDDSQMTVNDGSQAPVLPPTQTLDAFSSLASVASVAAPPPARLRIYFHTPVNADDSRPIPYSSSTGGSGGGESTRKGKRKKLEDDDGDFEEGRSRPPPPQMHSQAQSIISDDRSDIAPSATSEGDWLMAAIAETEEDDHRHAELLTEHDQEEEEDADRLHVSQLVDPTEQDESADSDRAHADVVADPAVPADSKPDVEDEVKGESCSSFSNGINVVDFVSNSGGDPSKHLANNTSEGTDDVNMVAADKQPSDTTSAPSPETVSPEAKDASSPVDAHASSEGEKEAPKSPTPVAVASDSTILAAPEAPSASDSVASSEHSSVSASVSTVVPPLAHSSCFSSLFSIFEPPPGAIPPSEITITESQVMGLVKSLLGASQPTLLNIDQPPKENGSVSPGVAPSDDGSVTVTNGPGVDQDHMDDQEEQSQVAEFHRHEMDHLPEPPASPQGSNTFLSNSSTSTYGGSPVALARAEQKTAGKTPSANRLSISFAGGGRRLVINAEVVESMKVYRQQGRIDVVLNLIKEEEDGLKGILLEHLSDVTKSYLPLENVLESSDGTLPPFSKMTLPGTMTLQVYLDKDKPLSEPKWVKTGDITEWLRTMFGRMFWVAGDAAEGWEKKIIVADPDPPPTIWTVLEGWASNSPVGTASERQRFLKTQMSELENVMEVLLRLVRGERATPSHQLNPTVSLTGLSGPLLSAMQGSEYGSQQTHVSLAVLAMFKMAIEYAEKALGTEEGKKEAEDKIGEIIRSLPSHLIYKSLDGIFKEWRVEKKGR